MNHFGKQVAYYLGFHLLISLFILNKSYNKPLFLHSNLYKPEYVSGEVPAKRVILYLLEDFQTLEVINDTVSASSVATKPILCTKSPNYTILFYYIKMRTSSSPSHPFLQLTGALK